MGLGATVAALALPATLYSAANLVDNPWSMAVARADNMQRRLDALEQANGQLKDEVEEAVTEAEAVRRKMRKLPPVPRLKAVAARMASAVENAADGPLAAALPDGGGSPGGQEGDEGEEGEEGAAVTQLLHYAELLERNLAEARAATQSLEQLGVVQPERTVAGVGLQGALERGEDGVVGHRGGKSLTHRRTRGSLNQV